MIRWLFTVLIAVFLGWWAHVQTDGFSPSLIQGPLISEQAEAISSDCLETLSQPFHYLGKGRQCFVFVSEDGKYVLKFFNQKYFQVPWYAFLKGEKEVEKREQRRHFYETSYEIAFHELGEQILLFHRGRSDQLPPMTLTDKTGRPFVVDLNQIPFVLQRKGIPFYEGLEAIYKKEGLSGLHREIEAFKAAIRYRIEKKIADADQDVQHNWGYVDGELFHMDPGRLFYDENLSDPERLKLEWGRATRNFHKWLKVHYPEAIDYLSTNELKSWELAEEAP